MREIAVDTGVWIESIAIGSTYFDLASEIVERINKEEILAVITPITASETYYVAYKIYKMSGLNEKEAIGKAEKFFNFLYSHKNIKILINKTIAFKAGEIKRKYGIATSDAYLLAAAKYEKAIPIFRDIEKEMTSHLNELKNKYKIIFLSEIKQF